MSQHNEAGAGATDETEVSVNLDEAKLQIGDPIQLQSQDDEEQDRYYVKLIGFAAKRSVLVSAPKVNGQYLLLRQGKTFVVRAFSGKSVFAFQASVIKVTNTPFPYLHLPYPADVKTLVVRRGARATVDIIAAISSGDCASEGTLAGRLRNISISGALLVSNYQLGLLGDRIAIKFKVALNDVEGLLVIDSAIRSIQKDEQNEEASLTNYGLEFVNIEPQAKILLLAFVYQKLIEQA